MENDTKSDDKIQVNENINLEKHEDNDNNIKKIPEESSQNQLIIDNNNSENVVEKFEENSTPQEESPIIENNVDGDNVEKSMEIPENPEAQESSSAVNDAENSIEIPESQDQSPPQPTSIINDAEKSIDNPESSESQDPSEPEPSSIIDDDQNDIKISENHEIITPDPISDDIELDSDKKFEDNLENQEQPVLIDDKTSSKPIPTSTNNCNHDDDAKNLITQHVKSLGLQDISVDITQATDLGDNFMGYIGKLIVKGKKDNEEKSFNWVIKTAPNNELYRMLLNVTLLYKREAYIYEEVFPTFERFQLEKKILNPFKEYPKLIFTHLEPMKESIIMEDMKSIGYSMTKRQEPLSLCYVKLVMKTYAKLHAISYALMEQKPEVFKKLIDNLEDVVTKSLSNEEMAYKTQGPMMMNALETLDPIKDARAIIKFKKFTDKFIEIFKAKINKVNRYSVIGHGDSWTNNILWKYENINDPKLPTNICLLDWQVTRYGSPAVDLSYFLFTCTDKEFRDRYYNDMIRLYYYSLCEHLNELGCNPDVLLPFDALQKELKEFSVVGLYMTIFVLFIISRETSEMAEWTTEDVDAKDITEKWATQSVNADKYKRRIRDVIIDVFEKGYLDFIM